MPPFLLFPRQILFFSCAFLNSSPRPYHPLQFSSLINMNRGRQRGWFPNLYNTSPSSDSGTPHHPNQDNSSVWAARKNKTEPIRPPHQRGASPGTVEDTSSGNSQEKPVVGPRAVSQQMARSSYRGRPFVADSSSESAMWGDNSEISHNRKGRWGPNSQMSSLKFNYVPVKHRDQDDSSMSVTRKNEPSLNKALNQRGDHWGTVERKTIRDSLGAPIGGTSPKQIQPLPTSFSDQLNATYTEKHFPAATISESKMGQTNTALEDGSPLHSLDSLHGAQAGGVVESDNRGQDVVGRQKSHEHFKKIIPRSRSTSPKMEYAYFCSTEAVIRPLKIDQNEIKEQGNPDHSRKEISQQRKSSSKRDYSHHGPRDTDDTSYPSFDIFIEKPKTCVLNIFIQDNSSMSVVRKNKTEPCGPPHQRGASPGIVEDTSSGNSQEKPVLVPRAVSQLMARSSYRGRTFRADSSSQSAMRGDNSEISQSRKGGWGPNSQMSSLKSNYVPVNRRDQVNATHAEKHFPAATISKTTMGQTSTAPRDCSSLYYHDSLHGSQAGGVVESPNRGQDVAGRQKTPERNSSPKRDYSHHGPGYADDMSYPPFDLFIQKPKTHVLKASLFEKNREKRKGREPLLNDTRPDMLRPGMVLLKNFITLDDQIKILKKCRDAGLGPGGFYQPGYTDGAKLRLQMMCLGKDWDPQTRSYGELRSVDGAKPPIIPDDFRKLVNDAIQASHAMIGVNGVRHPDKAIPLMEPDVCIVNFYSNTGKLGLHQDRDESPESLQNGLPVVSFSIGDTAEFLYGEDRDVDKAEKIELKSGDVLIFGGKSRHIFHGVPSIIPNTAPKFLVDEVNLRSGRLNLTFRKY